MIQTPRNLNGADGRLWQSLERYGHRPAIVADGRVTTYAELARRARDLEALLRAEGVGEGDLVAVVLPAGTTFIATVAALVRMGAVYVPIDAGYPAQRIDEMLGLPFWRAVVSADGETHCRIEARHAVRVPGLGIEDRERGVPRRPFYGIFTSGSTGAPKCTVVFEDAVANLLDWYCTTFEIGASARVGLVSPVGFDLTQKNIHAPLLQGAAIVIPPAGGFDPAAINHALEQGRATHVNCAPSAMYLLLEAEEASVGGLDTLRWVVLGGEPILTHRLRAWARATGCRFANTYGPTECTDIVACHLLSDVDLDGEVPLGRPIPGVSLRVADAGAAARAPGAIGELLIEGRPVGAGYINDAALTAVKFAGPQDRPSQRSYRTGDLVSMSHDGLLRFHGRDDGQVKVRGNRVELGAVEAALSTVEGIGSCAVVGHAMQHGSFELIAFVERRHPIDDAGVRRSLRARLPGYMVPAAIVTLPALPLTPNGKVDRRALVALADAQR